MSSTTRKDKFNVANVNKEDAASISDALDTLRLRDIPKLQSALLSITSTLDHLALYANSGSSGVVTLSAILKSMDSYVWGNEVTKINLVPLIFKAKLDATHSLLKKYLVGDNSSHSYLKDIQVENTKYVTDVTLYNEILLPNGYFGNIGLNYLGHPDYQRGDHGNANNLCVKLYEGSYTYTEDATYQGVVYDPELLFKMCKDYIESGTARRSMLKLLCSLIINGYEEYVNSRYRTSKTTDAIVKAGNGVVTKDNIKKIMGSILRIESHDLSKYYQCQSGQKKLPVALCTAYHWHTQDELITLLLRLYYYPESHTSNNIMTIYNNDTIKLKLPEEVVNDLVEYYISSGGEV